MKYKVGDIVFSTVWKKDVIIRGVRPNLIYEVADIEYLSRFMYTHELNLKSREESFEKDMLEHQKLCDEIMDIQGIKPIEAEMEEVIHCPNGYIFKDENGNIIKATKIVLEKKKKEYPKTYEECYQITGLSKTSDIYGYKNGLLFEFQKLLIARDAYWKIAGEEMGLGKPWEPDWKNKDDKFIIQTYDNEVGCWSVVATHRTFAFPTPEMRDAFKKNFDPDIEICKELL